MCTYACFYKKLRQKNFLYRFWIIHRVVRTLVLCLMILMHRRCAKLDFFLTFSKFFFIKALLRKFLTLRGEFEWEGRSKDYGLWKFFEFHTTLHYDTREGVSKHFG